MRYWYLDSADFITLILIDKGYYDYDYQKPESRWITSKNMATNEEELREELSKMGFGKAKSPIEQLQIDIMESVSNKNAMPEK